MTKLRFDDCNVRAWNSTTKPVPRGRSLTTSLSLGLQLISNSSALSHPENHSASSIKQLRGQSLITTKIDSNSKALKSSMPRIEVLPNTSTVSAPGWAYVAVSADGYLDPSKAPIIPSGARSRAKAAGLNAAADSAASTTRQQAATLKRIAELDRDGSSGKDIPVPSVAPFALETSTTSSTGTARTTGKTAATRKILSSAKTFANYLADEEAARALAEQAAQQHASASSARSHAKRKSISTAVDRDVIMTDAVEDEHDDDDSHALDASTPNDADQGEARLLAVKTISPPTQAEIDALLATPALPYNAARAAPPDGKGPPVRTFCEICGYWGRVRCVKCGARVCGLDCKDQHMVECVRRYA